MILLAHKPGTRELITDPSILRSRIIAFKPEVFHSLCKPTGLESNLFGQHKLDYYGENRECSYGSSSQPALR